MTKVLSVGGSIIAPCKPDIAFLAQFTSMIREWIFAADDRKLILVAGGGAPARVYQAAYKETLKIMDNKDVFPEAADWIGIMATRLNAQLLKALLGDLCPQDVVYNPTEDVKFSGKVIVAAGWKPGFSTDNDTVLLAEKFSADTVVNLSNTEKVYTEDPRKNKGAKPLDYISWADFRNMVGNDWTPGKNTPFDPVASKKAQELCLTVICASGKDIANIRNILDGKAFIGTTISG